MKLRHVVVATVAASCLQGASAFKVTKLDKSVGKGALAQSRKYGIPTVQEIRQVSKTFAPKSKGLRKSERNAWEKSAEGKTKKKVNGKFAKNEMDAIRAAADANTDPAAPTIVGKEVEMGDVPEVHEDGIVELECPEGSDGMRIHYKWTGLGFPVVNVIDEEEVYTYNALEGYSDLTAGNAVEVELINTEILSYGCAAFPTGSTGARRRLLNTESCYGASDNADCVDNFNCASKNMDATPLENAKKAVARMLFSNENGDWLVCTGWLINGPADKVVFGTAYHCISSQAQAESLQVRFFFDAECGECYGDYATASAIGADIVAAIPETDFTLLTLRGDAPEGTVALGYNVDDMVDGETYYRLHHPGGNVLAYSESVYVHEPPATCGAGWENENFAYTIPSQGGVLSGSSGSALLNSAGQIVGQLKGVCAGSNWCDFGATKHVDGRFSESFPAIAAWLGNSAAPTVVPTVAPTNAPTVDPTDSPTVSPTGHPTHECTTTSDCSFDRYCSNNVCVKSAFYDFPSCKTDGAGCVMSGGNQKPGQIYYLSGTCYKAVTSCQGCLEGTTPGQEPYGGALPIVDCPGAGSGPMAEFPSCSPGCLASGTHQRNGWTYRIGGTCYLAKTGCWGCLEQVSPPQPYHHTGHLEIVPCFWS